MMSIAFEWNFEWKKWFFFNSWKSFDRECQNWFIKEGGSSIDKPIAEGNFRREFIEIAVNMRWFEQSQLIDPTSPRFDELRTN